MNAQSQTVERTRNFVPVKMDGHPEAGVKLTKLLPFAFNPRGVLIHRTAGVGVHLLRGVDRVRQCHSIHYHCGAFAHGVNLIAAPLENQLVCEACEIRCKKKGLPSADELVGRHVHVGRATAIRACCVAADQPSYCSDCGRDLTTTGGGNCSTCK